MDQKYTNLLDKLEPYIVTAADLGPKRNKTMFGKALNPNQIYSPLSLRSQNFIEKIYRLDELSFGDQGMGMEKWVFFDCSVMPGFVYGYTIQGSHLSPEDRDKLKIREDEIFPVSMYIAIPCMDKGTWFGHNLSSLNGLLKTDLSGLGLLTKYSALKFFEIETLQGATQWFSPALFIHTQIADLELLSSYTPIHSKAESLCYSCRPVYDDKCLKESKRKMSFEGEYAFSPTKENIIKLQQKIEQGHRASIKRVKSLNEIYLI